ncbi:Rne/Rng family ribonuclease [Coleofasciculus sp. FACHB-64]|uniref:Rne/Rng family ribonuclease n=1 Tax=Cyanophyceae TaxID=3028117 RepID=UPI0016826239|nr:MULTISPECIES: Rne/Rng family ribonuclease [unclassified Coleofasciculus]MBD1841618.1 Rne/Rng family ribonuclease [Coleofasciculus sp. FACHB-501]MBD1903113.1 Rne/Rng family ribonuclease [Coleofasciculus sp. FACHB-125]MBD2049045.1 Rne/Rng family ribonuclease [Coleofasciculus sp. FACHB-64]MBD2537502.1 Rne/Rng family ribonuclease [Coleofasciculus sp. FACHB-SPT36]
MPKQIIIAEQHRIAAVFWEDQIQELVVATGNHQVGDIYLGVVENVLPGIDAAFVNIGDTERNGFIHVTDLGPLRLKRSAGAITELLTPQQKVLVQVMKEPTGNKGPRLTGNVSLPGRYVVLMPFGRGVSLSRQIKSESERNRLRALAVLIKPAGMGLIVRTEAEGRSEEAIIEDLESLQKQWEAIQQEVNSTRAPALLNRDDDFIQRVLRDMYSAEVNRIVVDSHTGVKRVKQYLLSWSGGRSPEGVLIDHHRERLPILEYFRVNAAIREALKPRVDLPSGGYIIIQPTEALTVIDVNSGSFTRSATARETVLWTNSEAATEIARQLRLRNIAGVIIVDFIDMDQRRDQLQVLEHFNKALKVDKARPQIAQLSELGLVELTRKRQGQNIYELFSQACPTCGGLGHQVRLPGEPARNGGEISEHSVPVPVREVRTAPYRNERNERNELGVREMPLPDIRESRSEALDLAVDDDDDDDAMDLMHHPSYQERGGVNNNNRRRRRRRIGEPPAREEITKNPVRVSTSPPLVNHFRQSPVAEPEVSRDTEVFTAAPLPVLPAVEEGRRASRPERPKPSRQEVEPPEIVSIEMTPEQQDIYALMGISPLVLLNRQVKNPKSAIVSVTLPGESAQTAHAPSVEPSREAVSVIDNIIDRDIPGVESALDEKFSYISSAYEEDEMRDGGDETTDEEPPTQLVMPVVMSEPEAPREEDTVESASSASSNEAESSPVINRRRRRRSSATEASEG